MKGYKWIWEHGKMTELGPGYHYKQELGSLVVEPGERVTFYNNQDRQGHKSYVFYEGTYHDLTFYNIPKKPGVIHIEKTDITSKDLVEIGYYANLSGGNKFYVFMKVPVGQWKAPDHFWNDSISHLYIPFGVTADVYDGANFQGGSLIFSGNNDKGNTHIGLPDFGYGWKVSSMKINADGWQSAGSGKPRLSMSLISIRRQS